MSMSVTEWKKARQYRREADAFDGAVAALLIVVLVLVLLSMLAGAGHAAEAQAWTGTDTGLQAVFLATLAIDRAQTAEAMGRAGYREQGAARYVIGEHPRSGRINRYFAACAVLHTGIAYALPGKMKVGDTVICPRSIWQSVWIGAEVQMIRKNIRAGISVRF